MMKSVRISEFLRVIKFISIILILSLSSCHRRFKEKILIKAITVNSDMFGAADYAVEILEDSSYRMIDYSMDLDSVTLELIDPKENPQLLAKNTLVGKTLIDGNVLFFTPVFKNVNRAILENGYMDLYRGERFFRRLSLQKGEIYSINYFDQKRFGEYAVFNASKDTIFDKIYNLKQKDLIFIDSVLTSVLTKRVGNNAFYKQLKVYSNSDSTIVDVNMFLKNDKSLKDIYKFYPIISSDAPTYEGAYGKLEINLSRRTSSNVFFDNL